MREEPWFRDSRQQVREIVNRAVDRVEDHVVPLFRAIDESEAVDQEGSAVLVSVQGRQFVASAGHAMRACQSGLAIPDDDGQFLWPKAVLTVSTPPPNRHDDFLDLGVVELSPAEGSRLRSSRFLELRPDALEPVAKWIAPIVVALGFPIRDTTEDLATSVISGQLTQFGTGLLDQKDYKRARVDPNFHLLLRLRRESIMSADSVGAPPSWRGISGGGAWIIPISPADQAQEPTFAGVLLGRAPHHKKALQVTRADALYHFIRLNG